LIERNPGPLPIRAIGSSPGAFRARLLQFEACWFARRTWPLAIADGEAPAAVRSKTILLQQVAEKLSRVIPAERSECRNP
jgi:hypothetical protein